MIKGTPSLAGCPLSKNSPLDCFLIQPLRCACRIRGAAPSPARCAASGLCQRNTVPLESLSYVQPLFSERLENGSLQAMFKLRSCRRPAAGNRQTCKRYKFGQKGADTPRCYRFRKDLHHGECHRPCQQAHSRSCSQQDTCGTALLGVPRILPRKCCGVLRFILRLLPARSLRAKH